MLIVSYDFTDDKTRRHFSRFLEQYGHRLQYSVFQVRNSQRVLDNILSEIELKYKKEFSGADSVIIIRICEGCKKKVRYYGYAENDGKDLLMFS